MVIHEIRIAVKGYGDEYGWMEIVLPVECIRSDFIKEEEQQPDFCIWHDGRENRVRTKTHVFFKASCPDLDFAAYPYQQFCAYGATPGEAIWELASMAEVVFANSTGNDKLELFMEKLHYNGIEHSFSNAKGCGLSQGHDKVRIPVSDPDAMVAT